MGAWDNILEQASLVKGKKSKTLLIISESEHAAKQIIAKLRAFSNKKAGAKHNDDSLGFGIGFTYIEFFDEANEFMAHLDVYTFVEKNLDTGDVSADYKQFLTEFMQTRNLNWHELLVMPVFDFMTEANTWPATLQKYVDLVESCVAQKQGADLQKFVSSRRLASKQRSSAVVVTSSASAAVENKESDYPLSCHFVIAVINSSVISDKINNNSNAFTADTYDYIQQFLRVVALKHCGSLVYFPIKPVPDHDSRFYNLISTLLRFNVTTQSHTLQPDFVNQRTLFVPTGLDSLGKIGTLNEDFDGNSVSVNWSNLLNTADQSALKEYAGRVPALSTKNDNMELQSNGNELKKENTDFNEFLATFYKKSVDSAQQQKSLNMDDSFNSDFANLSISSTNSEDGQKVIDFFQSLKSKR